MGSVSHLVLFLRTPRKGVSMKQQQKRGVTRRLASLLVAFALGLLGVLGVAGTAQAATGNMLPPFDIGTTWTICRGYDYASHTGTSEYGIDLTGSGCDNSAAGRTVRAPMDGTVAYYQASYGNLCVNMADGRSYTLTHISSSITGGTVTAGQAVGAVGAAGDYNNGGVAHIHFEIWGAPNCYNSSVIPFDATSNAQICGAPDLTPVGPDGLNNGTWSGTVFTGESCGGTNTFQAAFQANSGNLYTFDSSSGTANTQQGMASGTSPAITSVSGGHEEAFQASNGYLYVWGAAASGNTQLGMASGTSPAAATQSDGSYVVAFQANTGDLWIYRSSGAYDTGQGMMQGTSPAIAASPNGGFRVAFQANTGVMYTYDSASGSLSTGEGMMQGTSPSIAALAGGGYEESFQANTGNLFVWGDGGSYDTQQGMAAHTSPAIAASPAGTFQVAFQANTGNLFTFSSVNGTTNTGQGMASGTSSAIVGLAAGGGYEESFQANSGNMFLWGDDGKYDTQQGIASGASPSISR